MTCIRLRVKNVRGASHCVGHKIQFHLIPSEFHLIPSEFLISLKH